MLRPLVLRTVSDRLGQRPGPFSTTLNVMPRSVLIVEDDDRVRHLVTLGLSGEGFEVGEACTGEECLRKLAEQRFDVVLLDLMLPGADGFEVCRAIRRDHDVAIIMVTARADSHDVVAGLEAGADDYVTKPFVAKELSARIRALLRRFRRSAGDRRIRIEDLELAPQEGVVRRGGVPIGLTRTEFRLLCELAEEPGRVLSREELLERVWGYDYFGDTRLVDVHVRRLRTKVEPDPGHPSVVVTVRGTGYRLGT
jgi:DNA-binding response OmpR family regulator